MNNQIPKITFFIALLLTVLLGRAPLYAAGPAVREVADGVYAFIGKEGAANSGFVVTEKGVVVIDSQGPRQLAMALREKIREITKLPVIYVINTHYHGDHTFGNQYMGATRGIIGHMDTRRALVERDAEHRKRFKRFFGEDSLKGFVLTPPDILFKDSLVLRAGKKTFRIVHVPKAHTDGDAYVYIPEAGVVFAGDILYRDRLPWLGDGSFFGSLGAVERLLKLRARVYIPGHGGVAAREDVLDYRNYLTSLLAEVRRLMKEGKTLPEIKKEIKLPAYSRYLKYREWLPLNAEKVYTELKEGRGGEGGR